MKSFAKPLSIILLCHFVAQDGVALPPEAWHERLRDLDARECIESIADNSAAWPRLHELGGYEGPNQVAVKSLAVTVNEAFEHAAIDIENIGDAGDLLILAKMCAAVVVIATSKGGYLNDLIAASGENVVILCAWKFLDKAPNRHGELLDEVISPMQREVWAKRWFDERPRLDPWLGEYPERLAKLQDDTGGFQAANYLGMGREYPEMRKPTVFEMIESPDLVTLWREVFFNNYEITAVIPAAIHFVADGGNLSPVPTSMPNAVEKVFGEGGMPYKHQLRGGRIHAEDIWRSRSLSIEKVKRDVNIGAWFGEQ